MNAQTAITHTPTPWAIIELPDQCDILAVAETGTRIAEFPYGATEGIDGANAAFIVRAVNNFDDLFSALREVGDWFGISKTPLDQFDSLAEEFRRETGYTRPGKDDGAMSGVTEARRAEAETAWIEWARTRRVAIEKRVNAALAKAQP